MWLEDDGEDAAMLPCLPFRGCDVADGFLALAMGVCGAFCDLAVLCGIPPPSCGTPKFFALAFACM